MANRIFYQEDCNLSLLDGKTIAIIGYGSQGTRPCAEFKRIRLPGYSLVCTKEANPGKERRSRDLKYIQQQRQQRRLISS